MEPGGTGASNRTEGVAARVYRLLDLNPEVRVCRTRPWAVVMLVSGLVMFTGVGLIAYGVAHGETPVGPPWLPWYQAVCGVALALLALSDLLVGRPGARRAVPALRTVAQLGFTVVVLGWAWAAVNGSGLAAFALVFGFSIAFIAYAVRKADARRS